MNEATKRMVQGWLEKCHGDRELVARFMRDALRLGSIKACRAALAEALEAK